MIWTCRLFNVAFFVGLCLSLVVVFVHYFIEFQSDTGIFPNIFWNEEFVEYFGENIATGLFEDVMMETALILKKKKKNMFDLQAVKAEMSPSPDKYVFIVIDSGWHASIVVVDQELFNRTFFPPVQFGQVIDGTELSIDPCFQELAREVPAQQYHVSLDENGDKYMLSRNYYDITELTECRSFYVGETALAYIHLQLLSLLVVPSDYKLIIGDCLEFAKAFSLEIAVHENGIKDADVKEFFFEVYASNGFVTRAVETAFRNSVYPGLFAAHIYSLMSNPRKLILFLFILIPVTTLVRGIWRSIKF